MGQPIEKDIDEVNQYPYDKDYERMREDRNLTNSTIIGMLELSDDENEAFEEISKQLNGELKVNSQSLGAVNKLLLSREECETEEDMRTILDAIEEIIK